VASFYQDIYDWLQTFPDLVVLFGTRMRPVRLLSDETFPALAFRKISNPKMYSQDGESNLKSLVFQMTIWDKSLKDSSEAADTFEQAISGYRGVIGSSMAGKVFILNRVDLPDPDTDLQGQVFDVEFSLQ
jgi:hypothetical protein